MCHFSVKNVIDPSYDGVLIDEMIIHIQAHAAMRLMDVLEYAPACRTSPAHRYNLKSGNIPVKEENVNAYPCHSAIPLRTPRLYDSMNHVS